MDHGARKAAILFYPIRKMRVAEIRECEHCTPQHDAVVLSVVAAQGGKCRKPALHAPPARLHDDANGTARARGVGEIMIYELRTELEPMCDLIVKSHAAAPATREVFVAEFDDRGAAGESVDALPP